MAFVIRRIDQGGGYVTEPGSLHSYTKNKAAARRFDSRAEAEVHRCTENEVIEEL